MKPEVDREDPDGILCMIGDMNRCWTETWDEEKFRRFIHPDAVAVVPSAPGRIEGRDAYVAGWRAFATGVSVRSWQESDHRVQVYANGTCAVVTYFFVITFVAGGGEQRIRGRDMFFLVRENGRWLVAADQFSPEPAPS